MMKISLTLALSVLLVACSAMTTDYEDEREALTEFETRDIVVLSCLEIVSEIDRAEMLLRDREIHVGGFAVGSLGRTDTFPFESAQPHRYRKAKVVDKRIKILRQMYKEKNCQE